uniref:ShKT domain-containing protein n=1 Tax=Panagrolaimus sp. PS1159 TaxID=55785 RepID=A0AC35FKL9_9BILA
MIKFLLFAFFIGTNIIGFIEAQATVCSPALTDADGTVSCPTGFTANTTVVPPTCCITSATCLAALLENGIYICPTTLTLTNGVFCCNSTTTTNTTCRDLIGPRGYSDCPARAYLCNNTVYYTLMTQQCPRTCGRCTTNSTTTVTSTSTTCVDLAATGRTTDCPSVSYLCTNALYRSVMQVQCRRTCGFCTVTG